MPTATFADHEVELNDEGFFVHPDDWTEAMAPPELARREGINEGPAKLAARIAGIPKPRGCI